MIRPDPQPTRAPRTAFRALSTSLSTSRYLGSVHRLDAGGAGWLHSLGSRNPLELALLRKIILSIRPIVYLLVAGSIIYAGEHEVSLNISGIKNRSFSVGPSASNQFSASPEDAVSLGLRFGFDFAELGSAKVIAQTTIHSEYTTEYHFTQNGFYYREGTGKYKNEGISIGLNARWQNLVEYGIGAEVRYEHLTLTDNDSTTVGQYRPWISFYTGRAFEGRSYKPFFGIEAAMPLTHSSSLNAAQDPKVFLRGISPKFEITLVFGFRK